MITINGSPLNVTLFPDNTSQVWQVPQIEIPDTNWVHVVWDFTHEGEIAHLAQLKDLLDSRGFDATLRIRYLPYGRQDKAVSNTTTFALHSFAKILNVQNWSEVIIHDPHSSVALDLIKNSRAVFCRRDVERIAQQLDDRAFTIFCFPDKGAKVKYEEVYKLSFRPMIYGEKVRDQLTGKITHYEVKGNAKDYNVLIVDDICDGGATFILLAKELLKQGAKEVNLFVTHGIFSKGLKPLFDAGIKRVYTQDGEASETQQHIAYRRI